jgi:predicted nucleotidyltransferase component of viral defense system
MTLPRRLIHNEFHLQDIAERSGRPIELIERDFALVTLAAHLTEQFPGQLCFKGGFVLRHVRGSGRLSGDIDATRTNPPKHKLNAEEVADAIRRASDEPLLRFDPGTPETDTKQSLDFDRVRFFTERDEGQLAVEVSYREGIVDEPEMMTVGPPYFEAFEIQAMTLEEATAEKLRTLLQRRRATDLSDLALILSSYGARLNRLRVRELAASSSWSSRGTTAAVSKLLSRRSVPNMWARFPGLTPRLPRTRRRGQLCSRSSRSFSPRFAGIGAERVHAPRRSPRSRRTSPSRQC